MPSSTCSYHIHSPSTFSCPSCHRYYGNCCVYKDQKKILCPVCNERLDSLGATYTAVPFWDKLGSFFLYPLQPASLVVLLFSVIILSFVTPDKEGVALCIVFGCVFIKYYYSIIESSMNGLATVPTLNTAFSRQGMDIFFKQFFVICAAAMLLIPAILTESKVLITIVSLTIDLLFPASIILLAMTRRIIPALTPSLMKSVVLILGSRYLLLFAFLFILSQGPTITLGLLSSYESAVTMPLVILLFCYFWLVMARLIGYTVFQHQGRFGFTSDDKEDKRTLTTDELVDVEFRQAQAAVEIFIKDGDFDSALALLRYKLETVPSDLVLEEYHHRLLMAMRNFTAVLSNSDNRIHRFQQSKRPDLAAIVYADCLKINPGYRPKKLTVAIKLAERMYANLEINGALKLLVGAHKNYPADQNIALAYMLAAEIYINSKQDKVKSQSLLKYVKRNFPQFPSKSRIEALETSLAV